MPTTSYSEPGPNNVFLPTAEATAYLTSAFGRDPKKYAVNRWTEIRPVTKEKGYFLRWKSEQALRSRYGDLRDKVWAEGTPRPRGQNNLEQFAFVPYQATRFQESFTIGSLTLSQADWPLHNMQTQVIAQQMMQDRTIFAANALANAAWASNQANVDGTYGALNGNAALLGAGHNFTNGTSTNPYIKIAFQAAFNIMTKLTGGAISIRDVAAVMSPDTALAISVSGEVNDIMARSQFAMPNLTGDLWFNEEWAIPDKLYGFRIIVEKTVQLTTRKTFVDAPLSAYSYVIPTGTIYFVTIPEKRDEKGQVAANVTPNMVPGSEKMEGGEDKKENYYPTTSTIVGFYLEELTIEAMEFPWDRLVSGSVVSNFDMQLSSWKSGFQLQKCLG
jgi:hypothetical protein